MNVSGRIQLARSLLSVKPTAPIPSTISAVPPAACVMTVPSFSRK